MLYVINAADVRYGGLHGMETWDIYNCSSEKEAIEIAIENSIGVINSYSTIYQKLESEVEEYIEDNMSEEEIEKIRDDIYREDIDYAIYKIKEDILFEEEEKNIRYLEQILRDYPEGFIKEYCEI